MQKEAHKYVKKCDQCQRFALNIHQPGGTLNPLSSSWPFTQWGLDILGPFPKTVGNKRFLLVGIDYFTKWVEAEPLANIRDVDAKKFIWKNIITRFGVPHTLISDNGLLFDSKAFKRYCSELGIANRYSTLAYLQGNGQVEAVNKVIVNGLKKRLDDTKGRWVEELPYVQALNPRTPSFFGFHQLQAPPLEYSLSFNGSNCFDHQGLENVSSLKTLSLCKGKLL